MTPLHTIQGLSSAEESVASTVIGCAVAVHRTIGAGFPEAVYHRALLLECEARHVSCDTQRVTEVMYRDRVVGRYRAADRRRPRDRRIESGRAVGTGTSGAAAVVFASDWIAVGPADEFLYTYFDDSACSAQHVDSHARGRSQFKYALERGVSSRVRSGAARNQGHLMPPIQIRGPAFAVAAAGSRFRAFMPSRPRPRSAWCRCPEVRSVPVCYNPPGSTRAGHS
jgi:PD-(D/E)XK nuclease superfamily